MKNITPLLITSLLLFSCNETKENTSLESLSAQKTVLVNKIDSLNKQLKTVEKQLSKLDKGPKLQMVSSLPVTKGVFKHYIAIQGVVKADKNILIRPELGGTVKTITAKEGQKVQAGDLLVQLNDATIKNNIKELNTQLQLATTVFERQKRLWAQKIGSEIQFLQTKTQKESLENSLAALKTQESKLKITAPFTGIVDEIFPKNGELTSPQFPVVRLLNLDKVYVEADVTETYLPTIKINTEVLVNFASINKKATAKISQVGHFINPDNRSFKTRINLPNKDHSIKPNLLADLKILDFKAHGITIPATLVQQDQNGANYVFVVHTKNGENTVVKKLVTVAKEYNHQAFISNGLLENDVLVNAGARIVKAGDIVKISHL